MDGLFALVQGAAGESPRAALIAPQGAVLEQDALGGVVDQEPGGAEPPPEPSAVALDPGITGIAWARGRRGSPGSGSANGDSPAWGVAVLSILQLATRRSREGGQRTQCYGR